MTSHLETHLVANSLQKKSSLPAYSNSPNHMPCNVQDVLVLCRKVDEKMAKIEKVSYVLKVVHHGLQHVQFKWSTP